MKFRKVTAIILAIAVVAGVLAGCNKSSDSNNVTGGTDAADATRISSVPGDGIFDNVFTETRLPIEVSEDRGGSSKLVYHDGKVYFSEQVQTRTTDEDGRDVYTYVTKIVSVKLDGTERTVVYEADGGRPTLPEQGEIVEDVWMQGFSIDADGALWVTESVNVGDYADRYNPVYEDYYRIRKIDSDITIDMSELGDGQYMYVQTFEIDGEGNIYVKTQDSSQDLIYVFNGQAGELLFSVTGGNNEYISEIVRMNTGEIAYTVYGTNGMVLKTIDIAARGVDTSAGTALADNGGYISEAFSGAGDYSLFYTGQGGVYGFSIDTGESELIVDFINSDINPNSIGALYGLDDGSFLVRERDGNWRLGEFLLLTPDPDATLDGKILITLGGIYLDEMTFKAVTKFNKSQSDARITVVDYSQYNTREDYTQAETRFDMDLLQGRAPDIISLTGMQAAKYIANGTLADLTDYLDADPDVRREDLFESVLQAGSTDGRIHHIIPSFSLQSLAGKTSIFGAEESITSAKLLEIAKRYPNAALITEMTSQDWMYYSLYIGLDEYVDWETGVCSFNSQGFIDALEVSKLFPKEIDYDRLYGNYDEYRANYESMYRNDNTLIEMQRMDVRSARQAADHFGEPITFIGLPTAQGSGNIIVPSSDYGITASSQNIEACWQFVKQFLVGDDDLTDTWSMSISKARFEERAAVEMIPLMDRDFSKGIEMTESFGNGMSMWVIESPEEVDQELYGNYHLTRAEVDQVLRAIEGATTLASGNEQIAALIFEECESFWSGAKSAADTADMIQRRVSLYVSESM